MRRRRKPHERLREVLRRRTPRDAEAHQLQLQVAWINSVSTLAGLVDWLDARAELGLLKTRSERRYAQEVINAASDVILEPFRQPQVTPKESSLSHEQRMAMLNERERQRRDAAKPTPFIQPTTTAERMRRAYDRLKKRGAA